MSEDTPQEWLSELEVEERRAALAHYSDLVADHSQEARHHRFTREEIRAAIDRLLENPVVMSLPLDDFKRLARCLNPLTDATWNEFLNLWRVYKEAKGQASVEEVVEFLLSRILDREKEYRREYEPPESTWEARATAQYWESVARLGEEFDIEVPRAFEFPEDRTIEDELWDWQIITVL